MSMLTSRRFLPLFVTQFIGAFCDNVFKNAFVLLATYGLALEHGWNPAYAVYMIGGLFILPFVLISGWAGYVSDIWPRHTLVRSLKTFEAFVMLGAAAALYFDSFYGMWAIIVSLGFISALFGPLKYGLLPVYLPSDELVKGNAWFEAGSFIAIVTGTLVGELATENPPHGRVLVGILLLALGVIGCVSTYFLPKAPAAAKRTISPWSPRSLRVCTVDAVRTIRRIPVLWRSVLGVSWFWCLGAVLLSFLPIYVKDTLHQDAAGVTHFLLYFALGVGLGSFLGMVLSHGKIRATYVPLAGLAISAFLFLWVLADRFGGSHLGLYLTVITLGIGTAGGVYSVPLYALMQHRSPEDQRGRVISANNIMNAVFMVAGALGAVGIAAIDPGPRVLLTVLGATNFLVSLYMVWLIPESVIQTVVRLVLRLVFRVRVRGIENFPASGPRLVVANHTSWLDAALLAAFLPEPPIFAVDSRIARLPWVSPFLKWTTAYAIDPMHPISLKTLCGAVEKGGVVAIFPEGRLTTTGGLMKVYDGAGFIAQKTGAQIVPVHIDGAQLSVLTRLGGKYRRQWFPRITLTVGAPAVMPESVDRRGRSPFIYALLSESAFRAQSCGHSLYRELLDASRRHRGGELWVGHDGRTATYSQILGRSAYLGTRLAAETAPGEVVGIMMPTSMGGGLAFWGLQFAHRVPAWLNFSMGSAALTSTLRTAGVRTVVTSRAFIAEGRLGEKLEALEGAGARVIYLEDQRPSLAGKVRAAWMGLRVRSAYGAQEARWTAAGADPRSTILFTSGSSGLPKAVVLSHANLLSNVAQLRARIDFSHKDCVFNALPLFHAFGFTGGMLTPLFSGVRTVLYPTPLHYGIIPEFIYSANATIFFATNSFLNGYARKANAYDFYSLRYVFAGAEKLQPSTQKLWNERFGIRIFEGYGTTEASPALAMNTPLCCKAGTVGQFLPGINYRLEPVPGTAGGRLFFSGPNRMMGYYLPEAPGILAETDAWYDTGDIVSVDDQGFVSILGRAKRFAKIAGEMVSLSAVEEAVSTSANGMVAVVSRPHPTKGEELVLFTSDTALTVEAVRDCIRARGLSDLSVPRHVRACKPFPLLGSGKPDLPALQQLATLAEPAHA